MQVSYPALVACSLPARPGILPVRGRRYRPMMDGAEFAHRRSGPPAGADAPSPQAGGLGAEWVDISESLRYDITC